MRALIFINIRTCKKIHQVLGNFSERFNKKEAYKFICVSVWSCSYDFVDFTHIRTNFM